MVQEAVQYGAGEHRVAEGLGPFGEALIRRHYRRVLLIAPRHKLEEEHRPVPVYGDEAHLVDDEDAIPGVCVELRLERAVDLGPLQLHHQVAEIHEIRRYPLLRGAKRNRGGEVGLPYPRGPDEQEVRRDKGKKIFTVSGNLAFTVFGYSVLKRSSFPFILYDGPTICTTLQ